jgi:hypothetical protein
MISIYLNWSCNNGRWSWKFIDSDYNLLKSEKRFLRGRENERHKKEWRVEVIIIVYEMDVRMVIDMDGEAKDHTREQATGETRDTKAHLDETCTRPPEGMITSGIWTMDETAHHASGDRCQNHMVTATTLPRGVVLVGENQRTMTCLLDWVCWGWVSHQVPERPCLGRASRSVPQRIYPHLHRERRVERGIHRRGGRLRVVEQVKRRREGRGLGKGSRGLVCHWVMVLNDF